MGIAISLFAFGSIAPSLTSSGCGPSLFANQGPAPDDSRTLIVPEQSSHCLGIIMRIITTQLFSRTLDYTVVPIGICILPWCLDQRGGGGLAELLHVQSVAFPPTILNYWTCFLSIILSNRKRGEVQNASRDDPSISQRPQVVDKKSATGTVGYRILHSIPQSNRE